MLTPKRKLRKIGSPKREGEENANERERESCRRERERESEEKCVREEVKNQK